MSIIVTADYKRSVHTRGVSATLAFVVSGCLNNTVAEAAVGTNGQYIPPRGAFFQGDNTLMANTVRSDQLTADGTYDVFVEYAPLGTPSPGVIGTMRMNWVICEESVPWAYDVNGNLITNSAGDPPDPPNQKIVPFLRLVVRRLEASYAVLLAKSFLGTVNDRVLICPDGQQVDEKSMRCRTIAPESEYDPQRPLIWVRYEFDYYVSDNALYPSAWQVKNLDEGTRAFATIAGKRAPTSFVDGQNNPVTSPIRLNGKGGPMDTSYTLFGGVAPLATTFPAGVTTIATPDGKGTGVIWPYYATKDWTPLIIFAALQQIV